MSDHQGAIELVLAIAERYQISSIRPLLNICRAAMDRSDLTIAVLGRFKAGKSSFLNHLIGREVLPVGVIPVTAVVTEVGYGPVAIAEIQFSDGRELRVPITELGFYASEAKNPRNEKRVSRIFAQVPDLSRWCGIRFVDTPGLESAFAHGTESSLAWAPNVDLAFVAIGVDPPLSQHDIDLIAKLLTYTPQIAILLTKVDLLSEAEQHEVTEFVRTQLVGRFDQEIPIYPYSNRIGHENLRHDLEETFMARAAANIAVQRRESVNRKIETLMRECEGYLRLTLNSAEMLDSQRLSLQREVLAEKDALKDIKLNIQLTARNAAGSSRRVIEKALERDEGIVRREALTMFDRDSASFPKTFASMLEFFDEWLYVALSSRLAELSGDRRKEFAQPLADVQRQYQRLLQNFRDRLAEKTMTLYGIALRTTEPDIKVAPPKTPDVKIGRAFDHNWELLSPIIPMFVLRSSILRRFRKRIGDEVFKNFSRLTAQWEEIIRSAVFQLRREAEARVEDLIATLERLTSATEQEAPQIRQDLALLERTSEALRIRSTNA